MRRASNILFVALTLALVVGLVRFAKLRFEAGDLYPPYSTLRTDPQGAKALFQSLRKLEPNRLRRNMDRLDLLSASANQTIVFLGVPPQFNIDDENVDRLARAGARLVFAVDARSSRPGRWESPQTNRAPIIMRPMPGAPGTNSPPQRDSSAFLGAFTAEITKLRYNTNRLDAELQLAAADLPQTMPWFGRYSFETMTNSNWDIVYTLKTNPVVITKKVGLGSIVLCADAFPFSNEALLRDRSPQFLLWTFGRGNEIIFDETHLGLNRGTGVAVLMREFRLEGLVLGCLIVVGLWIWRNTIPLVPPPKTEVNVESETLEGKTAREAIVELLRRNIPEDQILREGLREWAKLHPPREYWQQLRLQDAQKIADAFAANKGGDLAEAQRQISTILFPKRT